MGGGMRVPPCLCCEPQEEVSRLTSALDALAAPSLGLAGGLCATWGQGSLTFSASQHP